MTAPCCVGTLRAGVDNATDTTAPSTPGASDRFEMWSAPCRHTCGASAAIMRRPRAHPHFPTCRRRVCAAALRVVQCDPPRARPRRDRRDRERGRESLFAPTAGIPEAHPWNACIGLDRPNRPTHALESSSRTSSSTSESSQPCCGGLVHGPEDSGHEHQGTTAATAASAGPSRRRARAAGGKFRRRPCPCMHRNSDPA